ncbi:hypothetical protein AwWohl_05010 [Gammaproteobacteria bacterium]|nr:hypothetical protein AwWohl_05010 [Gammaproteobacteria bacterium]
MNQAQLFSEAQNNDMRQRFLQDSPYDVIIIGAGPSGIGAATALKEQGIHNILILERESQVGGAPRHCGHASFGLRVYKYPMTGPAFIKRILAKCQSKNKSKNQFKNKAKNSMDDFILTGVSVLSIHEGGILKISSDATGICELKALKIIIATGARETPRHARLVSGLRPSQGVLTSGALQQMIYLQKRLPSFLNPIVIGTELVSFSVLWTLKNIGIKARFMLEENPKISAYRCCELFPMLLRIPLKKHTKLIEIGGLEHVEYITIKNKQNNIEKISCDAVIFTGKFIGENALIRSSHLAHDPFTGQILVDQFGMSSDPIYYATGNMLHPGETGDRCYLEGFKLGASLAKVI